MHKIKNKRKPLLSIIITSDNKSTILKRCIDSFIESENVLKKIEFIIINNYSENPIECQEVEKMVNKYQNINIIFYQSNNYLSKSQARNLGMDFSKGAWLYFINELDIATKKLIIFLEKFKFDIQKDFYRIPILNDKKKKIRWGFGIKKFYSFDPSTIILNSEFVERINLRWESDVEHGETLLLLNKIYSVRNVNYVYLKKQYLILHNNQKIDLWDDFDEVVHTYNFFLRNKNFNYKQFIILLFWTYLSTFDDPKMELGRRKEILKKMLKEAKITFFSHIPLGFKLFIKTIIIWFQILF